MSATAISLPVPPPPTPEVLAPAPNSVDECLRELRAAATAYRRTLARIAYYAVRLYVSEGWTVLGYPSGTEGENRFREEVLHIPRSTYFRARRIGQMLYDLPLEELEAIRPTNLDLLLQVSPAIWTNFSWTREAKALKPCDFAQLVAERNKMANDREPLATLSVRIPYLAKQALEVMLEGFRKRHELSSTGQALEMLVADRHDRPNLLSSAQQARQLLEGVTRTLDRRGKLTDESIGWLRLAEGVLIEACEKEIQAARSQAAGDGAGERS